MSLDRPRFRRDLEAVPLEVDGQRYVDVRDPTTGASFRLYDSEYHVALAFDGLTFDRIIPWLKLASGLEVEVGQLREFAARLGQLGFLEPDEDGEFASSPTVVDAGQAPVGAETATEEAAAHPEAAVEPVVEAAVVAAAAPPAAAAVAVVAEAVAPPITESVAASDGGLEEAVRAAVAHVAEAIPPTEAAPAVVEPVAAAVVSPGEVLLAAEPLPAAQVVAEKPASEPDEATPTMALLEEGPLVEPPQEDESPEEPNPGEWPDNGPAQGEAAAAAAEEPAQGGEAAAAAAEEPAQGREAAAAAAEEPAQGGEAAAAAAEEPAQGGEAAAAAAEEPAQGREAAAAAAEEPAPPEELAQEAAAPDEPPEPSVPSEWPSAAAPLEEAPWGEPSEGASPAEALPPPEETSPYEPPRDELPGAPDEVSAEAWAQAEAMPEPAPYAEPREDWSREVPAEPAAEADRPGEAPARPLDSTAFPVLPTPPPRSVESVPPPSVTPVVVMPLVVTPPARSQTPSYVTPSPATLGPLPVAVRRRQRRSLLLFGSLGVLAAAAVLAILLPFFFPPHGPPLTHVRTVVTAPGPVVRYFSNTGTVAPLPGPVLKFPAGGKVIRIASAGTAVAVGDIVAAVESARPLLKQVAHQRERLAFYQQMVDGMREAGNSSEEERQLAKVEERKARIAKLLRGLGQVAVVASAAGMVEESFTHEGETVEAGGLALRLASSGHRATFDLPSIQAAEARRLGFCQVGVDGYLLDCVPAPDRAEDGRVSVELTTLPAALVGRPARLARARWGGAVVLPAAAMQNTGHRSQVFVVAPSGRVEARPVTVAEQNATEAIVIQGLDAGENVIVAPPPNLRPGGPVSALPY